jgi:hypothetical protein
MAFARTSGSQGSLGEQQPLSAARTVRIASAATPALNHLS